MWNHLPKEPSGKGRKIRRKMRCIETAHVEIGDADRISDKEPDPKTLTGGVGTPDG